MPGQEIINAVGSLHHIRVRGIEWCKIFKDDADRESFVERFGNIMGDTETRCYAWLRTDQSAGRRTFGDVL